MYLKQTNVGSETEGVVFNGRTLFQFEQGPGFISKEERTTTLEGCLKTMY